jgi:hypothetical protein
MKSPYDLRDATEQHITTKARKVLNVGYIVQNLHECIMKHQGIKKF